MSYIGRQIPNTMDDRTLFETSDLYLTRSYSLSKNFASRSNTNRLTLDYIPTLLHTTGVNLFKSDVVNFAPGNPMDSYFARNQQRSFPTFYECKRGFLQGVKLTVVGSILYQVQNVGLVKLLALPVSLMNTDLDEFEVVYESDESLMVKLSTLARTRTMQSESRTSGSAVNGNIRDALAISTFLTINKKDITYTEYSPTLSITNYNIYTKIYEDDIKVVYYPLLKSRTPYDTFTNSAYVNFVENASGLAYRLIVATKATATFVSVATGVNRVDSTPHSISTPEVVNGLVKFYQSGVSEIYQVTYDPSNNALSHNAVAITNSPYTLSSIALENYEHVNYHTVTTGTVTNYRFKLNTTILTAFKVTVEDKSYLIRTQVPISERAWNINDCLNNRGDVVSTMYEIQSDGSLKFIKSGVLPKYLTSMIPLGGSRFLLIHQTFSVLDVKDQKFTLSPIPSPAYTLGSVLDSGDIILYQGNSITRVNSKNEGIQVAVVNSTFDPTVKGYYSVATDSSSLESITLKLTKSIDSTVLANTSVQITAINSLFEDDSSSKTYQTDNSGFVTILLTKSQQGQVGVRVEAVSAGSELPSYNYLNPIRRVPLYGSVKNWSRFQVNRAGVLKCTFTPQELSKIGTPVLKMYVQGPGGAYGASAFQSYQRAFWDGRQTYYVTYYRCADGGAGGAGSLTLHSTPLIGSEITVDGTNTIVSFSTGDTVCRAFPGTSGSAGSATGGIAGDAYQGSPGVGGALGVGLVTTTGNQGPVGRTYDQDSVPTLNVHAIPSLTLSRLAIAAGGTAQVGLVDICYDLLPFIDMSKTPASAAIVTQKDCNGYIKAAGTQTLTTNARGSTVLTSTNFTNYLRLPSFAFTASEDFSIEFWMMPIMAQLGSAGSTLIAPDIANSWRLIITPEKTMKFTLTSGAIVQTATNSKVLTDSAQHICIERVAGVTTLYVDGVGGTGASMDLAGVAVAYHELKSRSATDCLTSDFWNFRLTKSAIYNGNFTPPIASYQY